MKTKRSIYILVGLMSVALIVLIAVQYVWLSSAVRMKSEEFNQRVMSAMRGTAVLLEEKNTLKLLAQQLPADSFGAYQSVNNDTSLFRMIRRIGGAEENVESVSNVVQIENESNGKRVVVRTVTTTNNTSNEVHTAYTLPALPEPPDPPAPPEKIATVINRVEGECKAAGEEWDEVLDSAGLTDALHRQFVKYQLPAAVSFAVLRSGDSAILLSAQPHKVTDFAYKTELLGFDFTGQGLWLLVDIPSRSKHLLTSLAGMLLLSLLFTAIIIGVFAMALRLILKQKKLNEMTSDFISNMTHEFKTPLATISMTADTLQLSNVSNNNMQVTEYATMIKQETSKLARHVDRILEAATQERSEVCATVDMIQVVRKQLQLHENVFAHREAIVKVQLPDAPVYVKAEEENLGYVISNLFDNAVKYSETAPLITVTVTADSSCVVLKVEDRGIGIRREDREMIFEKFFRAHTGNRHDVKGFGLGLSFVKTTIESRGGKVWVESEVGKGSTFFVELKRAEA